jgi:hypothetical protein
MNRDSSVYWSAVKVLSLGNKVLMVAKQTTSLDGFHQEGFAHRLAKSIIVTYRIRLLICSSVNVLLNCIRTMYPFLPVLLLD